MNSSITIQSITQPLRKLLEKAKNNIDVIDFTKHSPKVIPIDVTPNTNVKKLFQFQNGEEHIRRVRMPDASYFPQVLESIVMTQDSCFYS